MRRSILVALGVAAVLGCGKGSSDAPAPPPKPTPPASPAPSGADAAAADAPAAPAIDVDVDGPTAHVFELWRDGKLQTIYDEAHADFRKDVPLALLQRIHDLMGDAGGAFTKLGAPLAHSTDKTDLVVKGPAIYAKGTLVFTLAFRVVDGKPLLVDFNLALPKELEVTPNPKDAEPVTRKMLAAMLAAKVPAELLDPSVLSSANDPALETKLKAIDDAIGKVTAIKLVEQHECSGGQCVTYDVSGSKRAALGTFEARFRIRRWQILQFELIPKR